jgi:hypothetical protein
VRALHSYWAYVVLASNLVVGVWGLVRWRRGRGGSRPFWIALGIAWGTIYVQGMLGLAIFNDYKPPFKHHFYGFLFAIITLAVLPLRSETDRTRLVVFSVATLFIGIVAVRAIYSL